MSFMSSFHSVVSVCVCFSLLNVILSLPRFSFIHPRIFFCFWFKCKEYSTLILFIYFPATHLRVCPYTLVAIPSRTTCILYINIQTFIINRCCSLFSHFFWFNKFCNVQFYRCHRNSQQPFASFTLPHSTTIPKVLCI